MRLPATAVHSFETRATSTTGLSRLLRLARVELRKLVDTRSGRWLLAVVGAATVLVLALVVASGGPEELTFMSLVQAATTPQLVLVPVVGILAATSEWSHRTALTTFTLEPVRLRVVLAKVVAAVVLAVVAAVCAVVAAAAAHGASVLTGATESSWGVDVAGLGGFSLVHLLGVVQGVAFGLLLMSTAGAVVAYFVLPTAWGLLTGLVPPLHGVAGWLDLSGPTSALLDGAASAHDWSRLVTAATAWVLVPLVVGARRTVRRDVG